MLLAVDVGNTNTVLGVFDGDELFVELLADRDGRPAHRRRAGADLPRAARPAPGAGGIAVCSHGAGGAARDARDVRRYYADVPAVMVEPGVQHRRAAAHRQPARGRRRPHRQLAGRSASTAGRRSSSTSARAPTSTWSRPKGEYLGGALGPGHRDLGRRPGRPRRPAAQGGARGPRSVIGKNTVEALQSGILYGFAGQVDGLVRASARSSAPDAVVVATGGSRRWCSRSARSTTTSPT